MSKQTTSSYSPPKVWKWEQENGGEWASINRPDSGARFEKALPKGKHPFQLYSLATPNGVKATIMFEELLEKGHEGAEYDAFLIKIGDAEQFGSGFVGINPNSKIPALIDNSEAPLGGEGVNIFESGAILLHLAERFDEFIPKSTEGRSQCLSWLFWQVGSGPYLGGGFGHFYAYAPETDEVLGFVIGNRGIKTDSSRTYTLEKRLNLPKLVGKPNPNIT